MTRPLSFGRATLRVARREFVERARDRSFMVSTGLTIAIIGLVVALPKLTGLDETSYRIVVADAAPGFVVEAQAQAAVANVGLHVQRAPASSAGMDELVREGAIDAYVDGSSVIVERELDDPLRVVLQNAYRSAEIQARLVAQGLSGEQADAATTVRSMDVQALDPDAAQAAARSQIAFVGSLILYGQLLGYGFWVALGVVEEKSSRVVELLLSAIPARALLAGKVLGIGLLGLMQLTLIGVVGMAIAVATDTLEFTSALLEPLLLVLGWFVLGYFAYSCLMAVGAARISRQEDLQNVTTPVTTLAVASFFATFFVASNPESPVSRVLAVIPPVSALTMPVRGASGDAAVWELPLALGLMIGLILALVVLAGRVYTNAVLRMGTKVSLREALRGHRPS